MALRLIVNGKKAGDLALRQAIERFRNERDLEVRATFEGGDIKRFIKEASQEGCERIIIAGGDGSINEAVNGLMALEKQARVEMAILPMGTANDFASAATISPDYNEALRLAAEGTAYNVDLVAVADQYFINVASAGFGAKVTANTPVALKNLLGGGAYTLSGLVQALSFAPYRGSFELPDTNKGDLDVIAAAVCNGRQAGGGQALCESAVINDGLFDVVAFRQFDMVDVPAVISELTSIEKEQGLWVQRYRVPWLKWHADEPMPLNLDGEPLESKELHFQIQAKAVSVVLPKDCPLIGESDASS